MTLAELDAAIAAARDEVVEAARADEHARENWQQQLGTGRQMRALLRLEQQHAEWTEANTCGPPDACPLCKGERLVPHITIPLHTMMCPWCGGCGWVETR